MGRRGGQGQHRLRCQAGAGGVVGVAEQQQAGRAPAPVRLGGRRGEGRENLLEGEGETGHAVRNRLDHHALHAGAGGVVAEGGTRGEETIAGCPVGLEQRMDGRIHPVEQAHLLDAEGGPPSWLLSQRPRDRGRNTIGPDRWGHCWSHCQGHCWYRRRGVSTSDDRSRHVRKRGQHGLPQTVVFRIDGVVIGRDGADRFHHPRTRTHRVLVEVEPQQAAPTLEGSAVGLEALHLGAGGRRSRHGCRPV